jgi:hypothetical protein
VCIHCSRRGERGRGRTDCAEAGVCYVAAGEERGRGRNDRACLGAGRDVFTRVARCECDVGRRGWCGYVAAGVEREREERRCHATSKVLPCCIETKEQLCAAGSESAAREDKQAQRCRTQTGNVVRAARDSQFPLLLQLLVVHVRVPRRRFACALRPLFRHCTVCSNAFANFLSLEKVAFWCEKV